MKKLSINIGLILIVALFVPLSGCAAKSTASSKTTVRVAVANDFNPYAFLDSKGNYTGYEVDVLKKVNELLPQYNFKYVTVSDQFVALTSDKADLITHQWEKNEERAKTYLFGDQLITTWANYIVVRGDNNDIKSLSDLKGKSVQVTQGGNDAYLIETYNKKHNNAIKVVYGQPDISIIINKMSTGAITAFLSPPVVIDQYNGAYKANFKAVGNPVSNSNTYFIYRLNDAKETALKTAVDGALKKLRDNGTLKKLSIQWLGKDYTEEEKLNVADLG